MALPQPAGAPCVSPPDDSPTLRRAGHTRVINESESLAMLGSANSTSRDRYRRVRPVMQRSKSPEDETPPQALTQLYTLRLWRARAGAPWRAALRPADGAAPIGFADLEQLALFLLRLADSRAPPSDAAHE